MGEKFLNNLSNSLSVQSFFISTTVRSAVKKIFVDCRGNFRVQIFLNKNLEEMPEGRLLSKGNDHAFAACGSARRVLDEFKNKKGEKTQ